MKTQSNLRMTVREKETKMRKFLISRKVTKSCAVRCHASVTLVFSFLLIYFSPKIILSGNSHFHKNFQEISINYSPNLRLIFLENHQNCSNLKVRTIHFESFSENTRKFCFRIHQKIVTEFLNKIRKIRWKSFD